MLRCDPNDLEVRGTYPEWVAFHGLAGSDAETGATPAGDGIPNLIKYASGLDPHAPAGPGDYRAFAAAGASNAVCLKWIESKTPTDLTRISHKRKKDSEARSTSC